MVDKVSNFRTNNLYYRQNLPWKFDQNNKERFEPQECKWGDEKIVAKDLFDDPTPKLLEQFDKEWINKIEIVDDDKVNKYKIELLKNGYLFDQLDLIIKLSRQNAFRAATWSSANESIGKKAGDFALCGLVAGVIKQALENLEEESGRVKDYFTRIVNFIYSLTRSQRNYHQYTMYSLPDDDSAMNVYQADVYGNKIAGSLAEASTFMETKINPLLLPLSEFLPKNIGESIRKLAVLPASLWWRARMPAYINQEFFTDFLRYIIHKPLSVVFGNSEKEIKKIEDRGNLKWGYVVRRHKENAGVIARAESPKQSHNELVNSKIASPPTVVCNDKEISLTRKLLETLAHLFNKDPTKQMEAGRKLGEFIAPALGIYGFFTSALGNTGSALFRLFNVENTFSKISNFIQATSIYSQQLIYLPKIMIPFLAETRAVGKLLKDKEVMESEDYQNKKDEIEKLLQKRQVVSGIGLGSFFFHTVNLIGKVMGDKKEGIGRISGLIDEIACNMTNIFFSNRRHVMGYQFRVENPEFVD